MIWSLWQGRNNLHREIQKKMIVAILFAMNKEIRTEFRYPIPNRKGVLLNLWLLRTVSQGGLGGHKGTNAIKNDGKLPEIITDQFPESLVPQGITGNYRKL